eukprot:364713-Chlamydomonas_euryale.AAC.4
MMGEATSGSYRKILFFRMDPSSVANHKNAPWLGRGFREARARLVAYHYPPTISLRPQECALGSSLQAPIGALGPSLAP